MIPEDLRRLAEVVYKQPWGFMWAGQLRAHADQLERNGEWQPISTAPKDGTSVLVWYAQQGGWCEVNEFCAWDGLSNPPTHWQPLPKPPEAK